MTETWRKGFQFVEFGNYEGENRRSLMDGVISGSKEIVDSLHHQHVELDIEYRRLLVAEARMQLQGMGFKTDQCEETELEGAT